MPEPYIVHSSHNTQFCVLKCTEFEIVHTQPLVEKVVQPIKKRRLFSTDSGEH